MTTAARRAVVGARGVGYKDNVTRWGLVLWSSCVLLSACPATGDGPEAGPDDAGTVDAGPRPVFEQSFWDVFVETRDCRGSHEHELRFIRVFVEPSALDVYQSYEGAFPVGSRIVKPEYDDEGCTVLLGYTAMEKLPSGASPEGHDWRWQKLDANAAVVEDGAPLRCVSCHNIHCEPPYGYDLTCAEEIDPGPDAGPVDAGERDAANTN